LSKEETDVKSCLGKEGKGGKGGLVGNHGYSKEL